MCHPASVDSLSTSAGTEDHVSMGGFAARKALQVVRNVEKVRVAFELSFISRTVAETALRMRKLVLSSHCHWLHNTAAVFSHISRYERKRAQSR